MTGYLTSRYPGWPTASDRRLLFVRGQPCVFLLQDPHWVDKSCLPLDVETCVTLVRPWCWDIWLNTRRDVAGLRVFQMFMNLEWSRLSSTPPCVWASSYQVMSLRKKRLASPGKQEILFSAVLKLNCKATLSCISTLQMLNLLVSKIMSQFLKIILSLSLHLSMHSSAHLFIYPSAHWSSMCLSIHQLTHHLCTYQSIIYLFSIYLSIYLYVHLFFSSILPSLSYPFWIPAEPHLA